jgi:hypothetical protein
MRVSDDGRRRHCDLRLDYDSTSGDVVAKVPLQWLDVGRARQRTRQLTEMPERLVCRISVE